VFVLPRNAFRYFTVRRWGWGFCVNRWNFSKISFEFSMSVLTFYQNSKIRGICCLCHGSLCRRKSSTWALKEVIGQLRVPVDLTQARRRYLKNRRLHEPKCRSGHFKIENELPACRESNKDSSVQSLWCLRAAGENRTVES
jgi:hypothetical protein